MRNVIENLLNFTETSNLYCVWVPVQDDGRGRLAAIWIDRAMTAFTADEPTAANRFTDIRKKTYLVAGEYRRPFLHLAVNEPKRTRRESCFGITLQFDWDWH
jgi:hypothetical protein